MSQKVLRSGDQLTVIEEWNTAPMSTEILYLRLELQRTIATGKALTDSQATAPAIRGATPGALLQICGRCQAQAFLSEYHSTRKSTKARTFALRCRLCG